MYTPIYRVALVREGRQEILSRHIQSADELAAVFRQFMKEPDREIFVVAGLSTKCGLIGLNTVSVGTLEMTIIHPREVFKPAIMMNAAAIVVAHNHPSGDPTPSPEDIRVTERLVNTGAILGIEVYDHLVIGERSYTSLRESGVIDQAHAARSANSSCRVQEFANAVRRDHDETSPIPNTFRPEWSTQYLVDGAGAEFDVAYARKIASAGNRVMRFPIDMFDIAGCIPEDVLVRIDHDYAMSTDLDQPLVFALWAGVGLLLDGWHRVYKALVLGVSSLPMQLLSEDEAASACVFALPDLSD